MVITGHSRDQVHLTPEQQGVVDKVIRLPETVNMGVLTVPRAQEGYMRVYLPLPDGQQVALLRTQPTIKTERGSIWRGEVEGSGERAFLMRWQDGHLSGYFGYRGRIYMINHAGNRIPHDGGDRPCQATA